MTRKIDIEDDDVNIISLQKVLSCIDLDHDSKLKMGLAAMAAGIIIDQMLK